jgi:hypothetical protein
VRSPHLRPPKKIGPTGLKYPLLPALFAMGHTSNKSILSEGFDELSVVTCLADVKNLLEEQRMEVDLDQSVIDETISIIEGSKAICRRKERFLKSEGWTRGKILHEIDSQIAVWDQEQKRAALYILDAPQRIRGLAGSGKTIVLAMRAARIHLQNPDARILYTFWTKSLYTLVKRHITRFYRLYADTDPDWDNEVDSYTFSHTYSRDFNSDHVVNFGDLALFIYYWQNSIYAEQFDLDDNSLLDMNDFAQFIDYWLERT